MLAANKELGRDTYFFLTAAKCMCGMTFTVMNRTGLETNHIDKE